MNKKEKTRFLTKIIWLCIINIMAYGWAIYVAGCLGVNAEALKTFVSAFTIIAGALGLELIMGAFIRLFGEKAAGSELEKGSKRKEGDG